jgi:hypothetical protein
VVGLAFGASGKHAPTNALGRLALEGTVWMLMCLPGAYAVSRYRIDWFFPAVLMIIGGRYLTFATLYGARVYWALGGSLGVAAVVAVVLAVAPPAAALAGATIELAFGVAMFAMDRARRRV